MTNRSMFAHTLMIGLVVLLCTACVEDANPGIERDVSNAGTAAGAVTQASTAGSSDGPLTAGTPMPSAGVIMTSMAGVDTDAAAGQTVSRGGQATLVEPAAGIGEMGGMSSAGSMVSPQAGTANDNISAGAPVSGAEADGAGAFVQDSAGRAVIAMGGQGDSNNQQDNADTDADGVIDADDNCPETPNDNQADRDDDGRGDACDNCPGEANPAQTDADRNGLGDACDPGSLEPGGDDDNDGKLNGEDNCPFVANNSQTDSDEDGIGDACDNCPETVNNDQLDADRNGQGDVCNDRDEDGILDSVDTCIDVPNVDQSDDDRDGLGDACDNCPGVPNEDQADEDENGQGDACNDRDNDGIFDITDNCPDIANRDQNDTDRDSVGNACDNCPGTENPDQSDENENGAGDVCDRVIADADLDGIADPDDNCRLIPNANQDNRDQDAFGDVCDNCPRIENDDQADMDMDGVGDICPESDRDGDMQPDLTDNCLTIPNREQRDQDDDGIGDACDNCIDTPNADQVDVDDDGRGDVCDVVNGMLFRPDAWVILNWGDERVDLNLHVLRPGGSAYSRTSDCWAANQREEWCDPGWRQNTLQEQVRLDASLEGQYTVVVEALGGPEAIEAAALLEFKCGEPIVSERFGPRLIRATPFTSGLWTAFTFNPGTCEVEEVNTPAVFDRYASTCEPCQGFNGGGCPGNYACVNQRFNRPGTCLAFCSDGACPADHECRPLRNNFNQVIGEVCQPAGGCN